MAAVFVIVALLSANAKNLFLAAMATDRYGYVNREKDRSICCGILYRRCRLILAVRSIGKAFAAK